jgi:hypothetical protein
MLGHMLKRGTRASALRTLGVLGFAWLVFCAACGDDASSQSDAGDDAVCELGSARCEAGAAQNCVSPCEDDPECGTYWEQEDCASSEVCMVAQSGGAFCALTEDPDPRCTSRTSYCDGDALIHCRGAYADTRYDCSIDAQTCGEADADVAICALASTPDPRCVRDGVTLQVVCDGDTLLECFLGFVTHQEVCASCVEPGVNLAMCEDAE